MPALHSLGLQALGTHGSGFHGLGIHSFLLVLGAVIAIAARQLLTLDTLKLQHKTWTARWYWTLGLFLVPPLFLGMMAIAIVMMGHHGQMLGHSVSWMGCHMVLGLSFAALLTLVWQSIQSLRVIQHIRQLPQQALQGQPVRYIDSPIPFAGRIGFWNAELVLSQNLSALLNEQELKAVLQHEQAHLQYRDTFWFFWLGWIRRITAWLPQTQVLWQELLSLREVRADARAAQSVDPLVMAEALFKMVQAMSQVATDLKITPVTAYFADDPNRLEMRIDAILSDQAESVSAKQDDLRLRFGFLAGLALAALPLLTNVWHSAL